MAVTININESSEHLTFNYRTLDRNIDNTIAVFDSGAVNLIWCGSLIKLKNTFGTKNIIGPVGKTQLNGFGKGCTISDVYVIKKFVLLSDTNDEKIEFYNFPILLTEPKTVGHLILPNNIFSYCNVLIHNDYRKRQLIIMSKKKGNKYSANYEISPISVDVDVFVQRKNAKKAIEEDKLLQAKKKLLGIKK